MVRRSGPMDHRPEEEGHYDRGIFDIGGGMRISIEYHWAAYGLCIYGVYRARVPAASADFSHSLYTYLWQYILYI